MSSSEHAHSRDYQGFTLWFTGLSGAGKTTLAAAVGRELAARGRRVEILDGDEVRRAVNRGLGFSKPERDSHVRYVGFVARLLSRNGIVAISAMISPYREVRDEIRHAHDVRFVEVFVDCPLEQLVLRDTKGLYARALRGEIPNFTGVSDPYEPPDSPDIHVRTDVESIGESCDKIIQWLSVHGLV